MTFIVPVPEIKYLNYIILNDKHFAEHRHEKYMPCYRTILLHAILYKFLMRNYVNFKDFYSSSMNKLLQFLEGNEDAVFDEDDFIKLFPLYSKEGYVLIDHSHGFYPLLLYTKKKDGSLSSRLKGFSYAVRDLENSQTDIVAVINGFLQSEENKKYLASNNSWSIDLQNNLQEKFHYPVKEDGNDFE